MFVCLTMVDEPPRYGRVHREIDDGPVGGQPFSDEPKLMLVGGLKHFLCSIIYGIILPIDEYLSRLLKPPTRMASMEILTSNGAKMSKCVNDDQGVLQ